MNNTANWIIGVVTVLIAVIVAFLALVLPVTEITIVRLVSAFVEIMIPFLIAGALIKYLLKPNS